VYCRNLITRTLIDRVKTLMFNSRRDNDKLQKPWNTHRSTQSRHRYSDDVAPRGSSLRSRFSSCPFVSRDKMDGRFRRLLVTVVLRQACCVCSTAYDYLNVWNSPRRWTPLTSPAPLIINRFSLYHAKLCVMSTNRDYDWLKMNAVEFYHDNIDLYWRDWRWQFTFVYKIRLNVRIDVIN